MNLLDRFLHSGGALKVAPDGQMIPAAAAAPGARVARALLPGSFNPLHQAHWQLAHHAEQILGHPVAFELSVANVDKPPLTHDEIRRRLTQFAWRAAVWLTHAPRFVDKAERFPGVWFVVGVDTAARLVSPRYYDHQESQVQAALGRLQELECHFLVACRVDARGQCLGLENVAVPPPYRDLFRSISPAQFRQDLSSTELRQRGHGVPG